MARCLIKLAFLSCFCLSTLLFSHASDLIRPNQSLPDGKFFASSNGTFEMGFFRPDNSKNRFFGIWYKVISTGTVVWVANRDSPLNDMSGALTLTQDGNLIVLNTANGNVLWSSWGNYTSSIRNPVAQLLESGNLVIRDENDENPGNFLWQSFDHPSDTVLPGMKMGKNLVTGLDRVLRSWKTSDDPSTGNYSFLLDSHGFPQFLLMGSGSIERFRSGPWNGERLSGAPGLKENPIYTFEFVFNQEEIYCTFQLINSSVFSRQVLSPTGTLQRFSWNYRTEAWTNLLNAPSDICDNYGICSSYGICDISISPVCSCLDKFKPQNEKDWASADWSGGCARRTPLNCKSDGFVKYSGVKLPDTRNSRYNQSMNLEECEKMCLKDCSCMAYANIDIRGRGSGCLLWFEDLMDIKKLGESGQHIYIRMASSEIASSERRVKIIRVCLTLLAQNKIGEGGFGLVYKGTLQGQEIAVKRLSKYSTQGLNEFKNEVILITKLQHRNLVRLLGCCIDGEEKMLIYEFMPNNSLATFIFG
ncbi:Non-specific serine/threonine protein kinase [Handroanthus impetiginosus]|uniref:Non-specific serine/threonine protein kinase n=1 Tax=Handroanthus impetiginosus TaxID=429701 RepID=A0A2G9FW99_9LAMI|nr:Non-specific serine/threonine protein kinase [Handroanthus impetiginosus]